MSGLINIVVMINGRHCPLFFSRKYISAFYAISISEAVCNIILAKHMKIEHPVVLDGGKVLILIYSLKTYVVKSLKNRLKRV